MRERGERDRERERVCVFVIAGLINTYMSGGGSS